MTAANVPNRIVAIGDPGANQEQIVAALSPTSQSDFNLVDVIVPSENLVRDILAAEPQLILVDSQTGEQSILDIIDDLTLQIPQVAIVAIIPGNDPLMAQQVMLAGARAFLVHPFTQINLLSTLRRVRDLEARRPKSQLAESGPVEQLGQMNTLVVYSPRGGAGCTTMAVNLAIAIHEKTGQRVLLMGGKLFFGHLSLMLNIRTNNSLADLIPHAGQLDNALIRDVVVEHATGIHILMEPFDFQIAQGIRPQELYNVLVGLQQAYDLIVVDAGSALTENTVTLMDAADRILLVTNPELASLQDSKRFIEISQTLGYQQEKLLLVLNRVGMRGSVKTGDIETALNQKPFAQIPESGMKALWSLNRGIPMVVRYPRHATSRSIKNLAQQLGQLMPQTSASTRVSI
jgi:pilus assembly protein CpaE